MAYQNKDFEYIGAEEYDRRAENSVLENYVLGLCQPFLKKIIGDLSIGKVVADLGCGTCEYTQAAKNAKKIYAIDISETMLKVCREKMKNFPQVEIINLPVFDVNLPPVDLVITIGVWEYIDPVVLFNKIKEITRQNSKIMVVFPNIYNDLNWARRLAKMSPFGGSPVGGKKVALRPSFMRKLFENEFSLIESDSFGMVSWAPRKLQFLALPIWKFSDWLWKPFQKFLPLGVNVYYLFERK